MNGEEEKRLIVLAAIIRIGGNGSKKQVLDEVERAGLMKLSSYDLQFRASRNELNWRNDLAYIRAHLARDGHIANEKQNQWIITAKGESYFATLASRLSSQRQFQHFHPDSLLTVVALAAGQQLSDENALSGETPFVEGQRSQHWTNTYERSPELRTAAIRLHGVVCMGCGFIFEAKYGAIGKGFIEVHHTKPISSLGGAQSVDPANDLVVLCSNCHSIVHRKRKNPLSIEELRALVTGSRERSDH